MKINNALVGALALAALAASAAPSRAATQITFASATGSGASQSSVFTYTAQTTPGSGGLSITPGAVFSVLFDNTTYSGVTFNLSGLNNVGSTVAYTPPFPGATAEYFQSLSGGTFSLTQNSGMTDLLSGSFTSGDILTGAAGSSTASVTSGATLNTTYDATGLFTASGLANKGTFSLSFTSVSPALNEPDSGNGNLAGFQAGGTGTFSASPAPEPSQVATLGLCAFGLLGLMARARKARATGAPA